MTTTDTTPTIREHLLPREAYDALLNRLMLAPAGFDHRSCLVEALGELANVWPDYVHDGVEITEAAQIAA